MGVVLATRAARSVMSLCTEMCGKVFVCSYLDVAEYRPCK